MAKLIVGIDFGTSTTVVRYKKEGTDNILPVKDQNGTSDYIPSAIFRMEDGKQSLYGHAALNAKQGGMEGELITNFKMGLLDADEQTQRQKKNYIEEFLGYVYQCFSDETQGLIYDSLDVYISYPAKWSSSLVNFMKDAVVKAGFKGQIYGINEPRAATYNIIHRHLPDLQKSKVLSEGKPLNVFMLDMGAGTTDIVIFRLSIDQNNNIEIDQMLSYPSVDNPCLCGGREIDEILSQYIRKYISEQTGVQELDEDFYSIYDIKFWKDQMLSPSLEVNKAVPMPSSLQTALKWMPNGKKALQSFLMTRTILENISAKHWERLYQLISSAINLYKSKFGVGAEDIDLLFLTGGHSKWYTVPNLFNGQGVNGCIGVDYQTVNSTVNALHFAKLEKDSWRTFPDALPHECVATGLCMQDEKIIIITTSPNNIWIKLTINEVSSEIVKVIEASQDIIPCSKEVYQKVVLSKNLVLGNMDFGIQIDMYSGEKLETAEHKIFRFRHSGSNFLSRLFALMLCLPLLLPADFDFELRAVLMMKEDGSIEISGDIVVDNDRKKHFTQNDMVAV